MSESCGRCRGEGYVIDEREGETYCPECGGEGRIDPYQEDEWFEDDEDGEYGYEPYWHDNDEPLTVEEALEFWKVPAFPKWLCNRILDIDHLVRRTKVRIGRLRIRWSKVGDIPF